MGKIWWCGENVVTLWQIIIIHTDEFRITCRTYQSGAGRASGASDNSIWQTASAQLQTYENQVDEILQSVITQLEE